jgi:PKD repeat protein
MKFLLNLTLFFSLSISCFSQCAVSDLVGSSSNMFTIGITESNSIAVDNNINSLIFIHRNNASLLGGHSGQLRYDISTNGGVNWTSNLGVLNPLSVNGTNAGRYPNVTIYNPVGNTNPNNAYLAYYATTAAAAFNGTVSGVRKLDGTGNTETYNQPVGTQTLIPRSLCKGAPGTFWAVDNVYNGTAVTGYRVLKGVWNGSNDIVWTVNTVITPAFNLAYNGSVQSSDYSIGFDPTGQKGWICAITHLTPGPMGYNFYPVFYKTTDGGNTWSGPDQVDIGQFSCVSNLISPGNTATAVFDVDLTVDVNGIPHALMCIGNGNNGYAVFFGNTHHMFDITQEHGLWNAIDLGVVNAGRNTFGTAPNTLIMDMEPQASRTDDGTKVFFTWAGSDAVPVALSPNLFGCGFDVVNKNWTPMVNFTSCNPVTSGKILFPKMAENVLNVAGGWELPVIYGESTVGTDVAQISNFRYLDSLKFTNANFTNPQCVNAISFAQPDTLVICQGQQDTLTVVSAFNELRWSTGSTANNLVVTNAGMYYVAARNGCCIGFDSVFVMIDSLPVAGYTHTSGALAVGFTETATNENSWAWNFGDGNTSTQQNPTHTYINVGTYNVCLIASDQCGADTSCQSVVVTCPAPTANFGFTGVDLQVNYTDNSGAANVFWDFGDGDTSTLANPTHVYPGSGTYTVCLIATDQCGSDTLCGNITVSCPLPTAGFTSTTSDLTASFTNTSAGGSSVNWDFGDGSAVSTQLNPVHNFDFPGDYVVCLQISDSCGTSEICDTISVSCLIPTPGFSFTVGSGGLVSFTNTTSPIADNYLWTFGDAGTSTLTNPTHTYTSSNNYNVCLIITDTCGTDTFCNSVTVQVDAGVENIFAGNIQVYPNPAHDYFYINGHEFGSNEIQLVLLNTLGQQVWSRGNLLETFNIEIPANTLSNGVYVLKVIAGGQVRSYKLLKE